MRFIHAADSAGPSPLATTPNRHPEPACRQARSPASCRAEALAKAGGEHWCPPAVAGGICFSALSGSVAVGVIPNPPSGRDLLCPPPFSFSYDQSACLGQASCYNIGRRTSMTDAAGSEAWSYDTMGRALTDQRTTNSVTKSTVYTYNYDGSTATLTYPSGRTITYTYDNAERSLKAEDTANGIDYATCAAYAPQGALQSMTLGYAGSFAGVNLSLSYNTRLQPQEIEAWSTTSTAMELTYNFVDVNGHNNGNVMGTANSLNSARSQTFTYDQVNRIASAHANGTSGSNCWSYNYGYDAWANLLSTSAPPGFTCPESQLSLGVATNNQVTNTGFSYDASGNELSDGTYQYAWNAESELKSAAGVNYTYDGDGRRAEKSNGKIYWYGLGGEILDESNLSGSITDEYVFFGGRRISHRVVSSGSIYYYVEDFIGSSRVITQSNGTVCYDADFLPFGAENDSTDTCASNYKFEGKERDAETGNDDFGARYYSSNFGRWLSPDWSAIPAPIPYADITNPQSLNLYSMVENNPETFADIAGHLLSWHGGSDPGGIGTDSYLEGLATQNEDQFYEEYLNSEEQGQSGQSQAQQPAQAQNQSNTQTQQNQQQSPTQTVLTQVKKEFPDLNVTNVKDLKAHNGHENISVTGSATNDQLAQIQKTLADNAGFFGPGSRIDIKIGDGTFSLHVEKFAAATSGDSSSVSFQSHIDRGNPNRDVVGLFTHVLVDGFRGAAFHPNDPGLDPQ